MININVGKVVGRIDGVHWAQIHDFSPTEESKLALRGRLLAIVTLKKSEEESEVGIVGRGREVLAHLHELYFGQLDLSAFDQLAKSAQTLVEEDAQIQLDCAVILDSRIHLISVGGGVWLYQNGREGWLIKPQAPVEISKLSGPAVAGQRMILGNGPFWLHIPDGVVRAAVESDLEQAVETLGTVAHGSQKSEGAAAIIIEVTEAAVTKPQFVVRQEEDEPARKSLDWLASKFPHHRSPVFVQYGGRKSSKTLIAGVIFLVIFGILGIIGRAKFQYIVSGKSKLDQRSEELAFKFNEARALVVLNPVRSRQLLVEIKSDLENIQAVGGPKYQNKSLDSVKLDLLATMNKSKGINEISPQEVLDLTLIRDGLTGQKLAIQDDKLMVLDTNLSRLVVVDPTKNSGAVVAGQDTLGTAKILAAYPGKTEILSGAGIIECLVLSAQCSVKIKFDKDWGEIVDMDMFAGNIYLLTDSNVWRYQTSTDGFGSKQNWIAKSETVDLSGSTSLTIDGSLWIADGQNMVKLTRGVKDSFEISGLEDSLGKDLILYTNEDADRIYVLDRTKNRIVVIKKTGEYVASYINLSLGQATDLVVNEKTEKIYLVAGSHIWQIDL